MPPESSTQRDRVAALNSLCYDYVEFEKLFGSENSYTQAAKSVKRKFESLVINGNQSEEPASTGQKTNVVESESYTSTAGASTGSKRSRSEGASIEPITKKSKPSTPNVDADDVDKKDAASVSKSTEETPATDALADKSTKPPVHKVRVGKMDYPAHPLTVRVTNLANETDDMDLVDLFRHRCGPIVHAKIVREKSHRPGKHQSRGWGLVQFEDRDSVEKALALHDLIGIHERVVKVGRSHVPAVSLVPPGMHRLKPKGEGKSSKRNEKTRERKLSKDETHQDQMSMKDKNMKDDETNQEVPAKAEAFDSAAILAFRPRGVTRRKPKISLGGKK
jgi:RNA recognition motif-containing protein